MLDCICPNCVNTYETLLHLQKCQLKICIFFIVPQLLILLNLHKTLHLSLICANLPHLSIIPVTHLAATSMCHLAANIPTSEFEPMFCHLFPKATTMPNRSAKNQKWEIETDQEYKCRTESDIPASLSLTPSLLDQRGRKR